MTSYDGQSITYDAIGNPLSYYNGQRYTMTWSNGRQLDSTNVGGMNLSYSYNADGQRTSKSRSAYYTDEYVYYGTQLSTLIRNGVGYKHSLTFIYDDNGQALGFYYDTNLNDSNPGTKYYYVCNAQGDVLQLRDHTNAPVANYYYDSWGKLLGITDANGNAITAFNSVAVLNPIRYRGYFYDTETGFYYLNSRYYDPQIGRFINGDDWISGEIGDTCGLNLFVYCGNNPVNRCDDSGRFWFSSIFKSAVKVIKTVFTITKTVCTIREKRRVFKELNSLPEPSGDITKSFRETLRKNADTVKETTQKNGIISSGKQFYNKVKNKGEWDLKQKPEYQGTFKFNDQTVQAQDIGNINFGYTGKALGLPDSVLLSGAGVAQILAGTSNFSFVMASNGDDLRDQMFIMYGIMLYKQDN